MHDAWILPRAGQSHLFRRASPAYRRGDADITDAGPVAMPLRAVHHLDLAADLLVYADGGAVHLLRGLLGGTASTSIKLPGKPRIHALLAHDGVLFTGAEAGKGMLGFIDLRAPRAWTSIPVPREALAFGKGVDGLAIHGDRLIAVDDIVLPRYLLCADIADPRAPRFTECRDLAAHSSAEHVISVSAAGDTLALLSTSANHGACSAHVSFLDLGTLEEHAALHVQRPGGIRRFADRSYDLRALALAGDRLLLAAGDDGLALLPVPPRLSAGSRSSRHAVSLSDAPSIPVESLRFVPVAEGTVVDVVPVDERRAFAIVETPRRGLFGGKPLDAVLCALPP
ncbi:MAG: hypothetical protein U0359_09460 [Byssovorax sp.]